MKETATITDKRQFTIPIRIYRELGLREGDKVVVTYAGTKMFIESARAVVERLSGAVMVPKQFKGMSLDSAIRKAKAEHMKHRYHAIR